MVYIKLTITIIMLSLLIIQIISAVRGELEKTLILCLIINVLNIINQFIR